jgi:hypothetical protein
MSEDKLRPEKESSTDIASSAGEIKPVHHKDPQSKEESVQPISESQPLPNESFEQTPLQKSETENMEVHHHGHVHEKKKWKEYIFQFLMLFLAVFCGFLAEYRLEHKIEKDREKQFMQSMVKDLEEDTAKLRVGIASNTQRLDGLDSLIKNIYHLPYTDSSLRMMYYLQRKYSGNSANVQFTKRTITQLKFSGGLRLIRNMAASDSIVLYDEASESNERQRSVYLNDSQNKEREFSNKIFDKQFVMNYSRANIQDFLKSNIKVSLLYTDEKLIKEYANWLYSSKAVLANYIVQLNAQQERAFRIMQFLQKEYHLE